MSLANVSNISVIELPIAANELSNGEYYFEPSISPQLSIQDAHSAALLDRTRLLNHELSTIGRPSSRPEKKILIIGASLSGKTTVYRQIRAMHGYCFSEDQRQYFRGVILDNLVTASVLISSGIRFHKIAMSAKARKDLDALSSLHIVPPYVDYDHATVVCYIEAFRDLLTNPDIIRFMRFWDSGGFHDNVLLLSYHFESLFITDCTVADSDIFLARSGPATAQESSSFDLGSTQIELIYGGRSYSEWETTWNVSLSTGDFLIFTVALSGYCRYMLPNHKQNQMLEAMEVFRKVSVAARFPILLLFTKIDVLEKLLPTHSFTEYFPGYSGPSNSSSICGYLASRFQQLRSGSDKALFIRVVNAADPEAFRKFFEEIESNILKPKPRLTAYAFDNDFFRVKPLSPLANFARRLRASQKIPDMDRPLITSGDDGDDDDADDGDDPSLYGYDDYDEDPPLNDGVETEYNDDDDDRSL
ncbi:MAG: hypothetical protein Q9195_007278 [Heterodermia aff. obscurata]